MSATVSSSGGFPELDKYELREEIGHGGMATVYRARDLRLDREVAVKIIHKHLRENPEVRRRFVSEAKAVAKLRHPGIVDVYDVSDEADPERYLVVELIRGQSLRQWLQGHERLPAEIGAILVGILCHAVEHAHQAGVIHRDIKPENVLLEPPPPDSRAGDEAPTESGDGELRTASDPRASSERGRRVRIKLTDFGIAKVLDAQGVTSTGQILGSPAHMAPEQIEGGEIGPHTDVFALGVLLYECLVGHLPFEGRNPAQVLRRVLAGDFEPADQEEPTVGQRWARIAAAALALEPTDRPPSAAALGAMIDEELEALGIREPRVELVDYFDDPDGYAERLPERIVPTLLTRGERERREGRAPQAAGDFNRALALKPDDLSILKRVSALSAHTAWRQRGIRMGAIVLGSLALGGTAFGVTRLVKGNDAAPATSARAGFPEVRPETSATTVQSAVAPEPVASTAPNPTAVPSSTVESPSAPVGPVAVAPVPSATAEPEAKTGVRRVQIVVTPAAAKLRLDGVPTSWFGKTLTLPVGPHQTWVNVVDSDCCEAVSKTINVTAPPEDDPDQVLSLQLRAKIKPARVALNGAPDGQTVTCNGKTTGGPPVSIQMGTVEMPATCQLSNGKQRSVKLRAGGTVVIQWPAGG